MSEILIPIKDFPRCCGLCPCFHAESPMYCQADKTIKMTAPYGKRMEGCQLVELPPHGRLIDADALQEYYDELEADNGEYIESASETSETIANAPTILEANR